MPKPKSDFGRWRERLERAKSRRAALARTDPAKAARLEIRGLVELCEDEAREWRHLARTLKAARTFDDALGAIKRIEAYGAGGSIHSDAHICHGWVERMRDAAGEGAPLAKQPKS